MADPGRAVAGTVSKVKKTGEPIPDALAYLGHAPAFAEAMRAIEAAVARTGRKLRPAGSTGAPDEEAVLFRSQASMAFAPSDIASITLAPGPWPVEMEVAFLGLYGPSSPLPAYWTERIVTGQPGAANIRDTLDLFSHPQVALAWRIWRDSRMHLHWDGRGLDVPSTAALALAGIVPGTGVDGATGPVIDRARLLPLCGLLASYSRSAGVVAGVISSYFNVPASIEEWVMHRVDIPPEQSMSLGSESARLGEAVVGGTVADVSGTVRLELGPLPLGMFMSFLPGGSRRPALEGLLRVAVREPVRVLLELVMAPDASPGMVLGGARLGWTSWSGGPGAEGRCGAGVL